MTKDKRILCQNLVNMQMVRGLLSYVYYSIFFCENMMIARMIMVITLSLLLTSETISKFVIVFVNPS